MEENRLQDKKNKQEIAAVEAKRNKEKTIKNAITKLQYVKDIGLIVTSFNGTIKFFDAFNFF